MNIKWQIPFVSLSGTAYTINVYDANYSGSPIILEGGAQPFTTDEDGDDDPFAPIRTQSGHLRIIDNGYAADGITPFNWKEFVPETPSSRPITLTHVANNTTIVDWQGFIQTQDYSGTLFGNPQERDFPVFCPLSFLESQQPSTSDNQAHNFAYALELAASTAESQSGNVVGFDTFVVQGNYDAQQWLMKKFEWLNVLEERDDADDEIIPKYNLKEILEDICKFWGWTCRSQGRTIYLTCYDDLTEPKWVSMTRAQLQTIVSGSVAGTNNQNFIATTLSGDIFASTDNDDFKRRGPSKATVQADCNAQDTLFEFAPPSVRRTMDRDGYTWVAGDEPSTGYFTTSPIRSFDSLMMAGDSTPYGGFCRRQIYSSEEQDSATLEDMFVIKQGYTFGSPVVMVQTKKAINYFGGTIKISGEVFNGAIQWKDDDENDWLNVNIGIGMTRETAKWYYISSVPFSGTVQHGWQSNRYPLLIRIGESGDFKNIGSMMEWGLGYTLVQFHGVPCDDNSLYGFIFIDILGLTYDGREQAAHFEVGNMKITYSRDELFIPTTTSQLRPRTLQNDRKSSVSYTSVNQNGTGEECNIDCIYASDNNLQYGSGLVINPEGTFMECARYGHDLSDPDLHNKLEHPEQHLADRITSFWQKSKRQVTTELRTEAIPAITPQHQVTIDGNTFNPTAISHVWRDDVTVLTLLESKTA